MIKLILLFYCVFAWGYGTSFLLDCYMDNIDKKSEYYNEDRSPAFLFIVYIFLLIIFPVLWPVMGTLSLIERAKNGN